VLFYKEIVIFETVTYSVIAPDRYNYFKGFLNVFLEHVKGKDEPFPVPGPDAWCTPFVVFSSRPGTGTARLLKKTLN
jgi:hypothetical protein